MNLIASEQYTDLDIELSYAHGHLQVKKILKKTNSSIAVAGRGFSIVRVNKRENPLVCAERRSYLYVKRDRCER